MSEQLLYFQITRELRYGAPGHFTLVLAVGNVVGFNEQEAAIGQKVIAGYRRNFTEDSLAQIKPTPLQRLFAW